MKFVFFILAIAIIGVVKFSAMADAKDVLLKNKPQGKVLVVYYSQSKNKNTETIAKWIGDSLGADMYEIEMVTPYPESYKEVLKEAKKDIDSSRNPAIKPFAKDVSEYDIVFIGSPIWYGSYAPPVGTFLAENNLNGKTIVPFCTHGGGGAKDFYTNIGKNAKDGMVISNGFTAKGSNIVERTLGYGTKNKVSQDDVVKWLNEIFK